MLGGYGGIDIYVSVCINGVWGCLINLGLVINILGDELYFYVSFVGDLYFFFNGLLGLGMMDLFVICESKDGIWQCLENFGVLFNLVVDDFGIVIMDVFESGYFIFN